MSKHEEDAIQMAFVQWCGLVGISVVHQNNNARSAREGGKLKKMGCTPGVADILIMNRLPRDPNARLALEFKTPKGRQLRSQKLWQPVAESHGWRYHIVRSVPDAVAVCAQYGLGVRR